MKELTVNLKDYSYPIIVIEDFSLFTMYVQNKNKCVIVVDKNVEKLHIDELKEAVSKHFKEVFIYVVEQGERSKSLDMTKRLYTFFIGHKICRQDVVMSFGGGVIGDLTGFVAATYMRGIQLIHVPTSLLAQVDSSIGGKTAVNLLQTKNIIGAFYQPSLVYSNYKLLKTLPTAEVKNGMVEILVHAIIKDAELFHYIEDNLNKILILEPDIMEVLIAWNCDIKKSVIERDEKDLGERAILNFGHTFGHAIESAMDYQYKHGECVALGILGACYISEELGLCNASLTEKIRNILKRMDVLNNIYDCDQKRIYNFLLHDKKVNGGKVYFVLPIEIGEVVKHEIKDFSLVTYAFEILRGQKW